VRREVKIVDGKRVIRITRKKIAGGSRLMLIFVFEMLFFGGFSSFSSLFFVLYVLGKEESRKENEEWRVVGAPIC
jgi:hypothetical protein